MLVVSAFSYAPTFLGDNTPGPLSNADLEMLWLDWCADLGGLEGHKLLLVGPHGFELPASVRAWGSYEYLVDRRNVTGWPQGPNSMFEQVGWHLALHKHTGPWLWCEPDCIPLRTGWAAELEHEYKANALPAKKPFMGVIVKGGNAYPDHMNGNGVYPANFHALAPRLIDPRTSRIAFDIRAAAQTVPKTYHTQLICNHYRCGPIQTIAQFRSIVPEGACLFHSDKYGRVIGLLKAQRNGTLKEADPFVPVELGAGGPVSTLVTVDSICGMIRDHVKSERDRQRLMNFLRKGNYHMINWGKGRAAEPAAVAAT
jgi:hypothetical protein